jgi:hypothetical protein
MSAAVSATTGAMSAPMMATMSAPMTPPNALASRPPSAPTTIAMSQTSRIVPNTCQPLPLTSWRLRPRAVLPATFSMTTIGVKKANHRAKMIPGTMNSSSPAAIAKNASSHDPQSAGSREKACEKAWPTDTGRPR